MKGKNSVKKQPTIGWPINNILNPSATNTETKVEKRTGKMRVIRGKRGLRAQVLLLQPPSSSIKRKLNSKVWDRALARCCPSLYFPPSNLLGQQENNKGEKEMAASSVEKKKTRFWVVMMDGLGFKCVRIPSVHLVKSVGTQPVTDAGQNSSTAGRSAGNTNKWNTIRPDQFLFFLLEIFAQEKLISTSW